jgi:hypothetical protein
MMCRRVIHVLAVMRVKSKLILRASHIEYMRNECSQRIILCSYICGSPCLRALCNLIQWTRSLKVLSAQGTGGWRGHIARRAPSDAESPFSSSQSRRRFLETLQSTRNLQIRPEVLRQSKSAWSQNSWDALHLGLPGGVYRKSLNAA